MANGKLRDEQGVSPEDYETKENKNKKMKRKMKEKSEKWPPGTKPRRWHNQTRKYKA